MEVQKQRALLFLGVLRVSKKPRPDSDEGGTLLQWAPVERVGRLTAWLPREHIEDFVHCGIMRLVTSTITSDSAYPLMGVLRGQPSQLNHHSSNSRPYQPIDRWGHMFSWWMAGVALGVCRLMVETFLAGASS